MCSSVNSNYVNTFPHLMHISSKFCSKLHLCIRTFQWNALWSTV